MKVLYIEDMSCEHCVKRITECLSDLELSFEVDLANKLVKIDGCENCVAKAQKALSDVGYDSVVV